MLVNELASQRSYAAVDERMLASRKDPAPGASASPVGLDLRCRKKKSVEEQRAQQEVEKKKNYILPCSLHLHPALSSR
jgi:hypothetical protein